MNGCRTYFWIGSCRPNQNATLIWLSCRPACIAWLIRFMSNKHDLQEKMYYSDFRHQLYCTPDQSTMDMTFQLFHSIHLFELYMETFLHRSYPSKNCSSVFKNVLRGKSYIKIHIPRNRDVNSLKATMYIPSTTSMTASPMREGISFFDATCTAIAPPMLPTDRSR